MKKKNMFFRHRGNVSKTLDTNPPTHTHKKCCHSKVSLCCCVCLLVFGTALFWILWEMLKFELQESCYIDSTKQTQDGNERIQAFIDCFGLK